MAGKNIGTKNGAAKLTEEKVRQLRADHRPGVKGHGYISLARKHGMSRTGVKQAIVGETWNWLD